MKSSYITLILVWQSNLFCFYYIIFLWFAWFIFIWWENEALFR